QRIDPGPQILLRRIGRGLGGALGSLNYRLHKALLAGERAIQLAARLQGGGLARPFKISFRRCGVTGSCVTAPGTPMASSIAEAIAAPTPVIPLSPAPLMPRRLSGLAALMRRGWSGLVWSSGKMTCTLGSSRVVGMR